MRVIVSLILGAFILFLSAYQQEKSSLRETLYVDTAVAVYGPYEIIKLPIKKGVKIANPIQLALGPGQMLYAANQTGEIYTLRDTDNDGLEDMASLYCSVRDYGLRSPGGFAYRGDTVYIGTAQQIRAFVDTNKDGKADRSWVFFDQIPHSEHPYEWTSGLSFGPDGWLYCALTTDSWNAAPSPDPNGYRGAILKISPDGKKVVRVATGVRSVYGMSFNEYGELFFIDNEGGGNPTEELNKLSINGFYGHNRVKYGRDSIVKPVFNLESEVAPSGIVFNKVTNDFGGTGGNLFIAYYGPGERWARGAVSRVKMLRLPNGNYDFKEYPIADVPKLSALSFGKDGSLYLAQHGKADYWYNAVYKNEGSFYKLKYNPSVATEGKVREKPTKTFSKNAIEAGKQLFAERACLGCHQVDGVTELLGPNLKDVAKRMTREEIIEEIMKPSERIKPSMMALRVIKKNGQVVIGRVVNADEKHLSLMLIGNHTVKIPQEEIKNTENVQKSLMYEGLLNGMSATEREALLDYMVSLSR